MPAFPFARVPVTSNQYPVRLTDTVGGGTKARSTPQDLTQPVLLAVKCEETFSSATGPVQLIYIAIQVSKNTDGLPPKLIIYLLVSTRNELRKHKKRTGRTGGANVS